MQTGLQEIEGTRYYLNASGVMQTGWKWFDNHIVTSQAVER